MSYKGIAASLMTCLGWALTGIWIQSLGAYNYNHIVLYRFTLTFVLLASTLVLLNRKKLLASLANPANWRLGILMLGFFVAAPYGYMVSSVTEVTLCINASPIFILLYSTFKTGRINKYELLGIATTFTGIGIVISHHNPSPHISSYHLLGDLAGLLCAVLTASYAVSFRNLHHQKQNPNPLCISLIGSAIGMMALSLYSTIWEPAVFHVALSLKDAGLLLGLTLCSTIMPVVAFSKASALLPAIQVTQIRSLTPLFATCFAAFILHESLSYNVYFGGALCLIGIYVVLKPRPLIISD